MTNGLSHQRGGERIFTARFLLANLTNFACFGNTYFLIVTLPLYIATIADDESQVGLIISVFFAAALLTRPLVGRGVDVLGRRVFIVAGATALTAMGALYAATTSVPSLLAVRIFHGIGFAAISTAIMALIADISPVGRRAEAMGYFGATINLAMFMLPALAVVVMQRYGFPVMFFSSAGLGLVAFIVSFWLSDPSRQDHGHSRVRSALVERSALFPSLVMCLVGVTWASIITFVSLFATRQGIENPGLFFTILGVVTIASRWPLGRLSDRYGRGTIIIPGLVLAAAGLVILAHTSSLAIFLTVSFLYGLGFAAVHTALMALVVDRAPPESRGAAMGTFAASMDLGVGAGSFLWGFVSQAWGFSFMYSSAAGVALLGIVVFMARRRLH